MAFLDRTSLAGALDRAYVPQIVLSLRRAASPWLTVLTYHRVGSPGSTSLLDDGVVDVTPVMLERQLRFVKRWFDVIALGDLLAWRRGVAALPPNPLLVTFDDGYRDDHDVALPLLVRVGVPATFFVATDYVERRRLFWWDRIALTLKRAARARVGIEYPERVELPLGTPGDVRASIRHVQRMVKDRRGLDVERLMEELERACGVTLGASEERRLADDTLMTWEQIAALRRAGMDVQSHTCSHRVLDTLSDDALAGELRESRRILERVMDEPVRALSYPVGRPLNDAPRIKRAVADAGYELGFSNGTGVNATRAFDALDVRRIAMDAGLGDAFFRTMLALPWLAYRT